MDFKVMNITPGMAKEWLANNNNSNRNIKIVAVERYARDMKNGNWELTSSPISFDASGNLLDGQHRLMAIVQSGCTVKMTVATRCTSSIYDVNVRRTATDIYKMEDSGNLNFTISSMVRGKLMIVENVKHPTVIDTVDEYKANKEQYDLAYEICVLNKGANKKVTKKGGICLACFAGIKAGYDIEALRSFFNTVATGFPDAKYEASPAIALRNYLINIPRKSGDSVVREQLDICSYALMCFMNGEKKLIIRKPKVNKLMQLAFCEQDNK